MHCAQAGVNHKNVPAEQISQVTSNTLAVHPAAATPVQCAAVAKNLLQVNTSLKSVLCFVLLSRYYLYLDKFKLLYQDEDFFIIALA